MYGHVGVHTCVSVCVCECVCAMCVPGAAGRWLAELRNVVAAVVAGEVPSACPARYR